MTIVFGPKWPFYSCILILMLLGQVMYRLCTKGRAPRTKETLPDFREEMSGHPTFTSFRGLTGSQQTLGNEASQLGIRA